MKQGYIGEKEEDIIYLVKCNNCSLEDTGDLLLNNYNSKSKVDPLLNLGFIEEVLETFKEIKKNNKNADCDDDDCIIELDSESVEDYSNVFLFDCEESCWKYKGSIDEGSYEFEDIEDILI